jgi:hypothetical protein
MQLAVSKFAKVCGVPKKFSPVALADYGYHLAYPRNPLKALGLQAFRDCILAEARRGLLS